MPKRRSIVEIEAYVTTELQQARAELDDLRKTESYLQARTDLLLDRVRILDRLLARIQEKPLDDTVVENESLADA